MCFITVSLPQTEDISPATSPAKPVGITTVPSATFSFNTKRTTTRIDTSLGLKDLLKQDGKIQLIKSLKYGKIN